MFFWPVAVSFVELYRKNKHILLCIFEERCSFNVCVNNREITNELKEENNTSNHQCETLEEKMLL